MELHLRNPQSFNEKTVWKKLYDRNPIMPIVADKYLVRIFLKEVLGVENAEKIMIPLLYVTDKPATIPFDSLMPEYIIKPNHASGKYIVVEKNTAIDRRCVIEQCEDWLSGPPWGFKGLEWAYHGIKRKILVEKLLRDSEGKLPDDYKFFIIHGKCHLINRVSGRFTNEKVDDYYTPEWNYLDIKELNGCKQAGRKPAPDTLESMISLAESLGFFFDSIRVDLYTFDGKIYFGELTNYHSSGRAFWLPMSFNYEMGAKWKMTRGYWNRNPRIIKLSKNLNKMQAFIEG